VQLKNNMARLSVHLVAWNGAKYIPHALASLRAQTSKDWELLVIDNASTDGSRELFKKELENFPVPARLIANATNLGFAKGHNQAVCETSAPYFQLYNQDIYLAPDYIERVVGMMDAHPEAGAGQGMLLKWDFSTIKNEHNAPQPPLNLRGGELGLTDVIDTMGLKVLRNRRVVDWGTGDEIKKHNAPQPPLILRGGDDVEVFGVSGALPIYRRTAIEEVSFEGKMFDEDFFMYKEDVDLAFRLRAAGWSAFVEPRARAWHDRTAAGPRETSDRAALGNRKTKSAFVNYHSYKNHLAVLLKNEHRDNFAKDWPWILWYEFKKFVYLLCTDWATLKGLREVKKFWPRTMEKRRHIMANYKVKPEEMRKWYV